MSIAGRLRGGRDPAEVRDELIALKEPERRKRAKAAQEEFERLALRGASEEPSPRWHAAALEWAGTATARKLATDYWRVGFETAKHRELADDVYAVVAARGRAFFETVARGVLREEGGWGGWPLVRRAVREGLIEPPEGDAYVTGMINGVSPLVGGQEVDSVYLGLLDDPQLLGREVWQLFEVDAAASLANATTWEPRRDGPSARGDNRWAYALTRLATEGRLDRDRLLDASLDALLRDFRASTVGWYARLHEELEPTPAERVARVDRYLSLVTSPAPAVVKSGLFALRSIEAEVPPVAFARVAPTPLTQRQKNLSTETLSLLARLAKRHPDERPTLLEAAAQALGHERADVQEQALTMLELNPDDAPRGTLLEYVDAVSPTLRSRVEALVGIEPSARGHEPVVVSPVRPPSPAAAEPDRLEPVASVDMLVELAGVLMEGQGDGDDCERFLDGVSRLCGERPPGFEKRTAGLAKRADRGGYWGHDASGAELVAYVVRAWTRRQRPERVERVETVMGFLARRAEEVARRAAEGRARPLLAFPTHRGGRLDPSVLEERLRGTGRLFNRADPFDRTQARVRALATGSPLDYERELVTRTHYGVTSRDLRLRARRVPDELGDLTHVAERAGAVEDGPRRWYSIAVAWAGFDVLGSRWALTVIPSLPDVAFAGAATVAVATRDATDTATAHPEAALEQALARQVPLTPTSWFAIAACLGVKAPAVPRVAVDLLLAAVDDGRFDGGALGRDLAWLLDHELAKASRLEPPLRELGRVSASHAEHALRVIESLLAALTTRPHALHALLEVAAESAAATSRHIEDERARATLAELAASATPSSKLGRLARSLLES